MIKKVKIEHWWLWLLPIVVASLMSCDNYGREKDKRVSEMVSIAKQKGAIIERDFKKHRYTYEYETQLPCLVCIGNDVHIADITKQLSKYATDSISWNCDLSNNDCAAWMMMSSGSNQYYIGLTKAQADWLSTHRTGNLFYIVRMECVNENDSFYGFFHCFIGKMIEIVGADINDV